MRIEIFGDKSFVMSAIVEKTPAGVLLIANLKERWGPVHAQGGSMYFVPRPGEESFRHDTIVFKDPTIEDEEKQYEMATELVIVAETEAESALFERTSRFEQQCKDQFLMLYVHFDSHKSVERLAYHASDEWAAFCAKK